MKKKCKLYGRKKKLAKSAVTADKNGSWGIYKRYNAATIRLCCTAFEARRDAVHIDFSTSKCQLLCFKMAAHFDAHISYCRGERFARLPASQAPRCKATKIRINFMSHQTCPPIFLVKFPRSNRVKNSSCQLS